MKEKKCNTIIVRVPPDMDEALRARALEQGVKVSDLCRSIFEGYLVPPVPSIPLEVQQAINASVGATVLRGEVPSPGPAWVPPASGSRSAADASHGSRSGLPPSHAPKAPSRASAPTPAWKAKAVRKAERAAGICPRCRPGMCVPEICACACGHRG